MLSSLNVQDALLGARSGRSGLSLTRVCVWACTLATTVSECATLLAVSRNMPGIMQRWSAASQTKDLINQLINQILSRLSLLKCAVAHHSPNVYLGTYVISQGCVVDICFLRLRDLCNYQEKKKKPSKLPSIIRVLFRSAVKTSSNTAPESRIHTLVWQRSRTSSLIAVNNVTAVQSKFMGKY